MRKDELEVELEKQIKLRMDAEIDQENSNTVIDQQKEKIEQLTKQKADLLADLVQYRTATFRLHESNAALLTLINKHQV